LAPHVPAARSLDPHRDLVTTTLVHVARYRFEGRVHFGRRDGDVLVRLAGAPWESLDPAGPRDPLREVELLAPTAASKIVCVGLNYRAHIAESVSRAPGDTTEPAEPLLFLKPPSALLAPGGTIVLPDGVTRMDPEGELAVVIGRRARRVAEADAMAHVLGFTCFNDVSARNYQKQDGQWARAKGFDTFAPAGPWIAIGLDPRALTVECRVNGERRQTGNTRDLIFPIPFLIRHVSHIMTLEPGDLIATGTPAGVAPVDVGDRIEVEVEGVGVLENVVGALD
jgi:2-keto-4-pentenoate hydratase/2-oxohepta-3-ene-1,7-dioic acid hydratase in catechol pathway